MAQSLARLSTVVLGLAVLAGFGCWDRGPSRVYPPGIDSAAASKALQEFDTNKDGFIDGAELDKVPGLKAALKEVDTNKDGKISADEINARIGAWKDSKLGRMPVSCRVTHNGQPLAGATVSFEPEKFLGDQLTVGSGTTNAAGMAKITAVWKEGLPGVGPGFYRVKVTKTGENIPAKYNTETTLGQEVANDAHGIREGIIFDLQY